MIVHLHCWAHLLLEQMGRQTSRCEIVINGSNLTVSVKHFIGRRATFSPNLHSVEEEALGCLPILQHWHHDFPTSYLKQAALNSWDNIYFGLPYLFQESVVLSQLQLAYLPWAFSYSLIKLQNSSFCESLINSSEVPKSGKTATTKYINKSLKKHHRYIHSLYHWVGKIHGPGSKIQSPKVTANLQSYL